MKTNRPSLTAELAAMMRATANYSRPLQNIMNDPYARLFCGYKTRAALFLNYSFTRINPSLTKINIPMIQVGLFCAICRHRYMENALMHFLQKGVKQVVLLGAGYDTKSLRIKNDNITFFELDHPSTQKRKLAILNRSNMIPQNTKFIKCNLVNENPSDCLIKNGFNKSTPTVVIAEGVLSYFTKEKIHELFCEISLLADELFMVFDYRHPLAKNSHTAKKWYRNFNNKGERYQGLLVSEEMNQLVNENGFKTESIKDLYNITKQFIPSFSSTDLKGISEVRIITKTQ